MFGFNAKKADQNLNTTTSLDLRSVPAPAVTDLLILDPNTTSEQLHNIIPAALERKMHALIVPPALLPTALPAMQNAVTRLGVACDMPYGLSSTKARIAQLKELLDLEGVDSIWVTPSRPRVMMGERTAVVADLRAQAQVVHAKYKSFVVAIECAGLTAEQVAWVKSCAEDAGADRVVTFDKVLSTQTMAAA